MAHPYNKFDVCHDLSCSPGMRETTGRRDQPPPILITKPVVLCGLAVNLGFDDLLAANIHFDLLGLGFGLLGEANLQHAFVIVGADLPRIYRTRERERAGEAS